MCVVAVACSPTASVGHVLAAAVRGLQTVRLCVVTLAVRTAVEFVIAVRAPQVCSLEADTAVPVTSLLATARLLLWRATK